MEKHNPEEKKERIENPIKKDPPESTSEEEWELPEPPTESVPRTPPVNTPPEG